MSLSSVGVVGTVITAPVLDRLPPYAWALGLTSHPFPVTPDETQYFFTPALEAIYEELGHFIEMRKGFLLLTGDIGLGKTTLIRRLLASFDKAYYNTALILTSFLNQAELLEVLAHDFGVKLPPDSRRINHLSALNEFLLTESASGKINVLFIDDAQALDANTLDVVRQLSNLETAETKLIQVVLCGQQELVDTLNQFDLRQVKSRIALHRKLQPMDFTQTQAYIRHRLDAAGAADCVEFTADGLQEIYECTAGYPRRIHHLMDRCLYAVTAFGGPVERTLVLRASEDLGWQAPAVPVTPSRFQVVRQTPEAQQVWSARPWPCWRAVLTWLGLSALGAAALAGFLADSGNHDRTPITTTATAVTPIAVADLIMAPAYIAAPASWETSRAAFIGLTAAKWPTESTLPALVGQLQKDLQPHLWKPLAAAGDWVPACRERPLLVVRDAQGMVWRLSFVELLWPIAPVVLGYRNESLRRLQQLLQAQGLLRLSDVDGTMGLRTAYALARFQLAEGIEGTGQFNPATAYRLSCRLARGHSSFNSAKT